MNTNNDKKIDWGPAKMFGLILLLTVTFWIPIIVAIFCYLASLTSWTNLLTGLTMFVVIVIMVFALQRQK